MAKKQGCGSQLLGMFVLICLCGWGINSCAEKSLQSKRAEEKRRSALTPEQRDEEDRIKSKKIADEEAAKVAATKAVVKKQSNDIEAFRQKLRLVDKNSALVVSVTPDDHNTAKIAVTNAWHISPYQLRLQAAQNFWEMWASIASPKDVDKARISIVDFNDNEVGGSRILAGSLIWVQDK
jgi:hypothetical protein